MRLAILGMNGQVASELQRRVPDGVTIDVYGRDQVDFSEPWQIDRAIAASTADAVINAVAYTAVDKAESDEDLAFTVNETAVRHLGQACAAKSIPLVHISTDYVFPGTGDTPWKPEDATGPLGVYGASKLAGEIALAESGARHVTLRTSWVFSAFGKNFVKTMLYLGAERANSGEPLTIINDQFGGPTPAAGIADACFAVSRALVGGHPGGTYHFSGAPDVTWAGFAREIFQQSGLDAKVVDIPTSAYPTPAERPLNSRLDCRSLEADFGIERPDWRQALKDVLKDIVA